MKKYIFQLITITLLLTMPACGSSKDNANKLSGAPSDYVKNLTESPHELNDDTSYSSHSSEDASNNKAIDNALEIIDEGSTTLTRYSIAAAENCIGIIKSDGSFWVWGNNEQGRLYANSVSKFFGEPELLMRNGVQMVLSNDENGFVIIEKSGSMSNPAYLNSEESAFLIIDNYGYPINVENCLDYSVGKEHALILKDDNSLWAFGRSSGGALNGENLSDVVYEPIHVMNDVKAISAGSLYSLAIKNDGTLWGWGKNSDSQLTGAIDERPFIKPVELMRDVTYALATEKESYAVKTDSSLWAWGENAYSMADFESDKICRQPIKIMDDVEKIVSASDNYIKKSAFVLKTDGTLWAFGYGYLGTGEDSQGFVKPTQIMDNVVDVAAGASHTVALKNDGTVWWWGIVENSPFDSPREFQQLIPVKIFDDAMMPNKEN